MILRELVLVAIAGLCPLSFLIACLLCYIVYLQITPKEYEAGVLMGIPPGTATGVAAALSRVGFVVNTMTDEKVGIVNLIYARPKRRI